MYLEYFYIGGFIVNKVNGLMLFFRGIFGFGWWFMSDFDSNINCYFFLKKRYI